MNKRKVIYLCCPYSHDDASVREARFRIACRVAMKLMEMGYVVYSPISQSHAIEQVCGIRKPWSPFWKRQDSALLDKSDMIYIVGINGWPDSVGVTYERKRAKRAGKPERFLTRAYLTETCGLTREEINVGD